MLDLSRLSVRARRALRNPARVLELARCARESEDWTTAAASFLGLRSPHFPWVMSFRDGVELELAHQRELVTAWVVFFGPEYPVSPRYRTIVDAGANIGAFSIYAATRAPRAKVLALEPFPTTFLSLVGNIERNGLADRIRAIPVALAREVGRRAMVGAEWPSHVRKFGEAASDSAPGGPTVETSDLAELFRRYELERVDLLKIDVEGAEFETLMAGPRDSLDRVERLAIEYHPVARASKHELFAAIQSAGLQLRFDRSWERDAGVGFFARPGVEFL